MKRPLKAEEVRLWTVVASTVKRAPGRAMPEPPADPAPPPAPPGKFKKPPRLSAHAFAPEPAPTRRIPKPSPTPDIIEPLRKRRIARERDPIEARLDLHGLDQDRARLVLHDFLIRSHERGLRAVLVITGKGVLGGGVLRQRTPDWLAEPPVRAFIAGVSQAERHHGGDGALYIALKRRRV